MYGTNSNKGTFFQNDKAKEISTDKCIFGNFSQRVKDDTAEEGYTYESWSIRLVGVACGKALALNLADKTFISLTKWNAHIPFDKEKKVYKPYLLVSDFEVVENEEGAEVTTATEADEVPFE